MQNSGIHGHYPTQYVENPGNSKHLFGIAVLSAFSRLSSRSAGLSVWARLSIFYSIFPDFAHYLNPLDFLDSFLDFHSFRNQHVVMAKDQPWVCSQWNTSVRACQMVCYDITKRKHWSDSSMGGPYQYMKNLMQLAEASPPVSVSKNNEASSDPMLDMTAHVAKSLQ